VHGAREDELLAQRLEGLSAGPGAEGGVMTKECSDGMVWQSLGSRI
jgi:hypothetical protein